MHTGSEDVYPLNIVAAPQSLAAERYGMREAELPRGEARAPDLPATPDHDLVYQGGKTIAALTFTNFYLGGQQAWKAGDIQNIDRALAAAMSDRDLNNVMVQYFPGSSISTTFRPSTVLPDQPPATFTKTDVETLVGKLYGGGVLAGFDLASTVVNILLPSGTILSDQGAASGRHRRTREAVDSLHGLGGYHGSVHPPAGTPNATVYYAVGVYSERLPDGSVNGIPVFDQPWKNVVATFYHELNEARTDADVEDATGSQGNLAVLGWVSRQGEECGDYPVFEAQPLTEVFQEVPLTDGSGTVPVQYMYSNAVHGPEGPIPAPH